MKNLFLIGMASLCLSGFAAPTINDTTISQETSATGRFPYCLSTLRAMFPSYPKKSMSMPPITSKHSDWLDTNLSVAKASNFRLKFGAGAIVRGPMPIKSLIN